MTVDRPAAKSAKAYHHGDLRQALLEATLSKVDEDGPDGVSLAALARSLGVSQAAPYRHFPDRDALLAAVAAEAFRMFGEALSAGFATPSPRSPLARMGDAYIAFGLAHPGLYRLMFDSHVLGQGGSADLNAASQASFGQLVAALPHTTRPGGRQRQAIGIWVGLHGAVMLASRKLLLGPATTIDLKDLVDDILA